MSAGIVDARAMRAAQHVYTVREITERVKLLLEENLFDIYVRGEISNYRRASSGHIYFTLKDENAVLKAVLFRGNQNNVRFELEDGLKVIVHGNLNVFEKRGEYQILVDFIEPEGIGALQLAFEQLKEKLLKEGLFDPAHKVPIPEFPETVGIVTSPTGAALRDILNIINRRYRGIHIIIYPTLVQGEGAAQEIARAIEKANRRNEVEVLIVGRGGGSIEDLWPFNEEIVARAIYNSDIPIISAVGHEIDFTISDFAADLRAPTPSAAAELVVKNKEELLKRSKELMNRLLSSMERVISQRREKASFYSTELLQKRMKTLLNERNLILDELARSLMSSTEARLARARARFEKTAGQLNALSPLNTIARGFAVLSTLPEEKTLFSIFDARVGGDIRARLKDGYLFGTVRSVEKRDWERGR